MPRDFDGARLPPPPESPAELSAEWLAAVLPGVPVSGTATLSIEVEQLHPRAGLTARVARVRVDEPGPGLPRSVIAKFAAEPGPTRDLAERFNLYRREAQFYRHLAGDCGMPTPRYFFATRDEEPYVLVIEDIDGYELDVSQGVTLDQVAAVLELLVEMHSRHWDRRGLEDHAWLPTPDNPVVLDLKAESAIGFWQTFKRQHGRQMPRDLLRLGGRLARDCTVIGRLGSPPLTLIHGDMRVHNVLFRADDTDVPLAVIDWQTAMRGRGPIDVAGLFVGSLEVEQRRIAEAELLPEYHSGLQKRGVRDYDLDECVTDYRLAVADQFSQVIALNALIDPSSKLDDELISSTGTRLVAALLDLRVVDLVPMSGMESIAATAKRFVPPAMRPVLRRVLRR